MSIQRPLVSIKPSRPEESTDKKESENRSQQTPPPPTIAKGSGDCRVKSIPFHDGIGPMKPRSQALYPLPPLVVGRNTLVAACHVKTSDTNFFTEVESTKNFLSTSC